MKISHKILQRFVFLFLLFFAVACGRQERKLWSYDLIENGPDRMVIAFGSCAHEYDPQPVWNSIIENHPDLWVWLGDIVYGNTPDMHVLRNKYNRQKSKPGYRELLESTPVIGIWDDHDYGYSNAGKEYLGKVESRVALFQYLDMPIDNPAWSREGAYNSYTLEKNGKSVKIILLDGRYFRDKPTEENADILGEAQWAWLYDELRTSTADLNIIGSGIQVIPEDHEYEKWSNFPEARERLLQLITEIKTAPTLFISGDRHIGELSKLEMDGLDYPLYDFTSSGLTHSFRNIGKEKNTHRVGHLVPVKNYGLIIIDWFDIPGITFEVRAIDNQIVYTYEAEIFTDG